MSRIPPLSARELVRILKAAGYVVSHQTGSHLILKHPTRPKTVVPIHAGDLKRGTQMSIIRQAGFTDDEFLELV